METFSFDDKQMQEMKNDIDNAISKIDSISGPREPGIPPISPECCGLLGEIILLLEDIKKVICRIPIPIVNSLCKHIERYIDFLKGIC